MNSGDEVWFVNGLTEVPTLGSLLPATVVDLLSTPMSPSGWRGPTRSPVPSGHRTRRSTGPAPLSLDRSGPGTAPAGSPGVPSLRGEPQLDHVIPAPAGPTEAANLMCLCTSHHRFKHHGGWRVELTPGASAPGRRPTAGPTPPGRSTATDAAWPDGPLPGIRAKATPRHTLGRVMHSLGPDWMDPQWLLERFGGQFFWVSAAIVFIECGLLFPILRVTRCSSRWVCSSPRGPSTSTSSRPA